MLTAFPSGYACPARYRDRSDAWEFLSFAAGRGPAPDFADRVAVVVDGSTPVVLDGSEAGDLERWGTPSVLTELSAALDEVYAVPGSPAVRTPQLWAATRQPPGHTCGIPRPASLGRRTALSFAITIRRDGFECPLTVDLYRTLDVDGRIDAVVLYTARVPGS